MSPMPRLGRRFPSVVLLSLVVMAALVATMGPAGAQEGPVNGEAPADGAVPRTFTVRAMDDCPDGRSWCWDIEAFAALPGETVRVIVDLEPSISAHDFWIDALGVQFPTPPRTGGVYEQEFVLPDDFRSIEFLCSVHSDDMIGHIVIPELLGAQDDMIDIVHMGVNFYAYWVGVIAFALLFIVYGLTFFLFKHNETPTTTDHWDRSGADGKSKMNNRTATLLAVLVALVAIGLIAWLVQLG